MISECNKVIWKESRSTYEFYHEKNTSETNLNCFSIILNFLVFSQLKYLSQFQLIHEKKMTVKQVGGKRTKCGKWISNIFKAKEYF